ncbi:hypothetical protein V2J09_001423 [Rumex salicifolius]
MEKKKCFVLFILALVLLGPQVGVVVQTEAILCEVPSQKFRLMCISDRKCAGVCSTEGFPDGHCKGMRKRCFCRKAC